MPGLVVAGGLVGPGGDAAPVLEPVEAALDDVATFVGLGAEAGGWATGRALVRAVLALVGAVRDRGLDPARVQVGPVRLRGVGLVRQDPLRSGPGLPGPVAGHSDEV